MTTKFSIKRIKELAKDCSECGRGSRHGRALVQSEKPIRNEPRYWFIQCWVYSIILAGPRGTVGKPASSPSLVNCPCMPKVSTEVAAERGLAIINEVLHPTGKE